MDNGRFGKGWPGEARYHAWLCAQVERYDPARCLFALAPDIPMDARATLAESGPWLEVIRSLGLPVAFAAQDGSERPRLRPPYEDVDAIFLAGSTSWKVGPGAQQVAAEARGRGLYVHMGRVNSERRLHVAKRFGCHSVDGTFLTYGPDANLPRLLGWLERAERVSAGPDPG